MNTSDFANSLLTSLRKLSQITKVDLHTEGPIVSGRALIDDTTFLSFYYNQNTATQAFALVKHAERIWGIDFDDIRGWHLHPSHHPQDHIMIQAQDIQSIINQLQRFLDSWEEK